MKLNEKGIDFIKLQKKYPKLLRGSLLDYGCYEGWYDLINVMLQELKKSKPNKDFYITTIKEKYGFLNAYTTGCDVAQEWIIRTTENMSIYICEYCGNKGKIRDTTGWIKTRCDSCEQIRQDEIKEFRRKQNGK